MPFTFNAVFNRFFKLLGQNLPLLLLLGFFGFALPSFGVAMADHYHALGWVDQTMDSWAHVGDTYYMYDLMPRVLNGLFYLITLSMVTEVAILRAVNKTPNLAQVFGKGMLNILPIIGITILSGLWIAAASLLFLIPGIILWLALSVAIPAYVGERHLGVFGAINRSRQLTSGHKWTVFAIYLVLGILSGVISSLIGAALAQGFSAAHIPIDPTTVGHVSSRNGAPPLMLALQALAGMYNVLGCVLTAAIYVSLRESKDKLTPDQTASVFD